MIRRSTVDGMSKGYAESENGCGVVRMPKHSGTHYWRRANEGLLSDEMSQADLPQAERFKGYGETVRLSGGITQAIN